MPIEQPILLDLPTELTTERLLLRIPQPGDGKVLNQAIVESAAELAGWMPWASPTPKPEDTEIWVRQRAASFLLREGIHFNLYPKGDTGSCIGGCGMHRLDWKAGMAEIGYWLRTSSCGKGFMTEAAVAVTAFAIDVLKMQRVEIRCDERNRRSAAVAQRAGYELEGTLRRDVLDLKGKPRNTLIYAKLSQR